MKNNKNKNRSNVQQAIYAMVEVSKLFPNQDPIRLAAGVLDFKLPIQTTLNILRQLAPHFQGENSDMIRLASGFNDMRKQVLSEQLNPAIKKMIKNKKNS